MMAETCCDSQWTGHAGFITMGYLNRATSCPRVTGVNGFNNNFVRIDGDDGRAGDEWRRLRTTYGPL